MSDTAEIVAFRNSVNKMLGGARLTPASDDRNWTTDWPALLEMGVDSLFDDELGAGEEALALAVVMAEELAVALHPLPGPAILPVSAAGAALAGLIDDPADTSVVAIVVASAGLQMSETDGSVVLTGGTDPAAGLEGVTHVLVISRADDAIALVDLASGGVSRQTEASLDVTRSYSRLRFDAVSASRLSARIGRRLGEIYRLLLVVDTVALTGLGVERTTEYARERKTFGKPIGQNQAVQHRLVEHAIAVQQMKDLISEAMQALVSGDDSASERLLIAETFCSEHSAVIVSDCIQLTGGIGFTWEYGLHFALRRASGNAQLAGWPRAPRAALADLLATSR